MRALPTVMTTALLLVVSISAQAALITFDLASHPDGNQAPPEYGLRLDGLFSGNTDDVWTFDFADVQMTVNTAPDPSDPIAVIQGTIHGGRDAGTGWAAGTTADWDLVFVINDLGSGGSLAADGSFSVDPGDASANSSNVGLMRLLDAVDIDGGDGSDQGEYIGLVGHMGFNFNDDGHRCAGHANCGPFEGWGWVNHSVSLGSLFDALTGAQSQSHITASDFLFQTSGPNSVPEPAPLALLGLALLALAGRRWAATGR